MADYEKANRAIARALVEKVEDAIANSTWLVAQNLATGTDNPSTNLHELADKIAKMKDD